MNGNAEWVTVRTVSLSTLIGFQEEQAMERVNIPTKDCIFSPPPGMALKCKLIAQLIFLSDPYYISTLDLGSRSWIPQKCFDCQFTGSFTPSLI